MMPGTMPPTPQRRGKGKKNMKAKVPLFLEKCRVTTGPMKSDRGYGFNGLFIIGELRVIASNGWGWDHVSVSLCNRCPTFEELKMIKDLFWDPEETVVHFFPKQSVYINNHPFTLHLWKRHGEAYQLPPMIMV
jgi:hypothetical protein